MSRSPCADPSTATHAGQAQKESFVNELAARVDALLHLTVEGEVTAPPAVPSDGQCWLVAANPTGEWIGRAGQIAARQSGNWLFILPRDGMEMLNKGTGQFIRFNATWKIPAKPGVPSGGTTIDSEARTAIAAIVTAMVSAGIVPAT